MEAQFASKCAICGEEIEVGDEIRFDDDSDDWVHGDCRDD